VPFEKVAVGTVCPRFGQFNNLPGLSVELAAVAEIYAQPRADEQTVPGINSQVPTVEQGMDVRPE
jgi:hypothetical protein